MVKYSIILFVCVLAICDGRSYKEYDREEDSATDPAINDNVYLSKTKESYYEALQICREKSMQLVSIETSKKNRDLAALVKDSGVVEEYWTSGNQISKHEWWWLKGEPIEYYHWAKGSTPSDFGYHKKCIYVAKNGTELIWSAGMCNVKRLFICENLQKVSTKNCNMAGSLVDGDSYSRKRYYIAEDIVTYSKAVQMCRSMCMNLLSIEDQYKSNDVFQALTKADAGKIYWSSGYYSPSQSIWKWMTGETARFFSWNYGEPNNKREDEYCIEIFKADTNVAWNDQPCEEKRMFVCESNLSF